MATGSEVAVMIYIAYILRVTECNKSDSECCIVNITFWLTPDENVVDT